MYRCQNTRPPLIARLKSLQLLLLCCLFRERIDNNSLCSDFPCCRLYKLWTLCGDIRARSMCSTRYFHHCTNSVGVLSGQDDNLMNNDGDLEPVARARVPFRRVARNKNIMCTKIYGEVKKNLMRFFFFFYIRALLRVIIIINIVIKYKYNKSNSHSVIVLHLYLPLFCLQL